jgi:hypothetical protein
MLQKMLYIIMFYHMFYICSAEWQRRPRLRDSAANHSTIGVN